MQQGTSKTSLFLIELIITILFFSLASVVYLRLFAGAHMMSREAEELTHAVAASQNAAECFTASGGDPALFESLLSECGMEPALAEGSAAGERRCSIFFNDAWEAAAETAGEGSPYRADLMWQEGREGEPDTLIIRIEGEDGREIYSLKVQERMTPAGKGDTP